MSLRPDHMTAVAPSLPSNLIEINASSPIAKHQNPIMSKEDVAKFLELASRFEQLAARERDLDSRRKYAQRATLLRKLASAREKE